jgi:hypothetical protein
MPVALSYARRIPGEEGVEEQQAVRFGVELDRQQRLAVEAQLAS